MFYFVHVIHERLYNQALADIRSTGVGIECLYCSKAAILNTHFCALSMNT